MDRMQILDRIKLVQEGYNRSVSYSNSAVPLHLREEGREARDFYFNQFIELQNELITNQ